MEDPSGAAVIHAQVDVEESATHHHQRVSSDAAGRFALAALTPGGYLIVVSAPGLALAKTECQVELGTTSQVTAHMSLESVSAETTVTATTQESSAAATDAIGSAELGLLPLDGRRWQSFALLTPQANPATAEFDLLSFSGLAPTANSTRIDGVDDDQSYSGVPRGSGQDSGSEVEDETESGGSAHAAQRGLRCRRGRRTASGHGVHVL